MILCNNDDCVSRGLSVFLQEASDKREGELKNRCKNLHFRPSSIFFSVGRVNVVKRKDRKREGEGREFSIHVVINSQVSNTW